MGTTGLAFSVLLLAALAAASDMSIISYDERHGLSTSDDGRTDAYLRTIYESWLAHHGKAYNGIEEKDRRFEVFKDNLRFIDKHNSADHSYQLGLNKFADLTNEEYKAMYLGTKPNPKRRLGRAASNRYGVQAGEELPKFVDWREKGAVAPVKDQGSCGKIDSLLRLTWYLR